MATKPAVILEREFPDMDTAIAFYHSECGRTCFLVPSPTSPGQIDIGAFLTENEISEWDAQDWDLVLPDNVYYPADEAK